MNPWLIGVIMAFGGFLLGAAAVFFLGIRMRHADMDEVLLHMKRFDENMSIVNGNVRKVGKTLLALSAGKLNVTVEQSKAQKEDNEKLREEMRELSKRQDLLDEKLSAIQEAQKHTDEIADSILMHVKTLV